MNNNQGMTSPGYETLADVLQRAYDQAAHGKGKERHANDEPFHQQVMQTGAQRFGHGALLFQAFKKSEESQRMPVDAAVRELLGAINYLAGAVIALEAKTVPVAANDNAPMKRIDWTGGENPAPGKYVRYTMYFDVTSLDHMALSDDLDWSGPHSPGQTNPIINYAIIGELRNG